MEHCQFIMRGIPTEANGVSSDIERVMVPVNLASPCVMCLNWMSEHHSLVVLKKSFFEYQEDATE